MKYIALAALFAGLIWASNTPDAKATQAAYKATMQMVASNALSN